MFISSNRYNLFVPRISYLTFVTVIVFEYFPHIINDSSFLWIEYCKKDYEFCTKCFDDNIYQKNWNNLLKGEFGTLPINLVFGTRKVQRVSVTLNGDTHEKAVLKYFSNEDVIENFKKSLCRYYQSEDGPNFVDCPTLNSQSIDILSEILRDLYRLEPLTNRFTFCPSYFDSHTFFDTFHHFNGNNVSFWMQLWLNPELVILRAIQKSENDVLKNAVPKVIDWCGFVLLEEDTGSDNLIAFYDEPLIKRINLAHQLIEVAIAFSIGINGFRIYLTDATPDNIVVDRTTLRISFVDLDSLFIVNSELIKSNQIHRHQRIDCLQCFAFVPQELCAYHLSDINLFSVCQIFSEASAGTSVPLLHSIDHLEQMYQLNKLIDVCINCHKYANCSNRFLVANLILAAFKDILINPSLQV